MIALEMHVKELLLAEGLVAVAAGIRLLTRVSALVHDHVPLLKHNCWSERSRRVTGLSLQLLLMHILCLSSSRAYMVCHDGHSIVTGKRKCVPKTPGTEKAAHLCSADFLTLV